MKQDFLDRCDALIKKLCGKEDWLNPPVWVSNYEGNNRRFRLRVRAWGWVLISGNMIVSCCDHTAICILKDWLEEELAGMGALPERKVVAHSDPECADWPSFRFMTKEEWFTALITAAEKVLVPGDKVGYGWEEYKEGKAK